jgi:hypothetical protein
MKPNTVAFEKKAQSIIKSQFDMIGLNIGDVKKSAYLPRNDRGGWAPKSLLVVNHENGAPSPMDYDFNYHGMYVTIATKLSEELGFAVFFEPINGAVSALWKA